MTNFRAVFTLQAAEKSISFDVNSPSERAVNQFFTDFLSIFPGVIDIENGTITSLTRNSEEVKKRMKNFVANFPHIPEMKGIEAFINRLLEGETFFVIPSGALSQTDSITINNYLHSLRDGLDFEEINQLTKDLFGEFMQSYFITTFGDIRRTIGEKKKENKQCRFCGERYPKVSFNKKAHAISEALGNKTLVLTEECDDCNWRFSQTIEPDLIDYLALYRTMYGIKGKGGEKEFKGKNFKFFKNENLELHFVADDEGDDERTTGMPTTIKLDSGRKIRMQNIYRTLVKFVLSVIEKNELDKFDKTLAWVNGKREIPVLPKIAILASYDELNEQPMLTIFRRKIEDTQFPYLVGEFHFIFMKYIFIVPASDSDAMTFTNEEEYQGFWKKFKHLDLSKNPISFYDFSSDIKRNFTIKLNFQLPHASKDFK